MKKLFRWICGILGIIVAIALIGGAIIMIDIHRYGAGRVTFPQVVEVNLRHDLVSVGKDGKGEYFLTDTRGPTTGSSNSDIRRRTAWGRKAFTSPRTGPGSVWTTQAIGAPGSASITSREPRLTSSALSPEARGTHAVSAASKKQTAQRSLSYFPLPSTTAARYSRISSYFR